MLVRKRVVYKRTIRTDLQNLLSKVHLETVLFSSIIACLTRTSLFMAKKKIDLFILETLEHDQIERRRVTISVTYTSVPVFWQYGDSINSAVISSELED